MLVANLAISSARLTSASHPSLRHSGLATNDPIADVRELCQDRYMSVRWIAIIFAASLVGCGETQPVKPSAAVVKSIEERLLQDPCLNRLADLRREYRFARRRDDLRRDLVDISISEPGPNGPGGLFVLPPMAARTITIDDRQYFGASGTYSIVTNDLDLWACGMNGGAFFRHSPRL